VVLKLIWILKGMVLSLFTHPQVVSNLYVYLSSTEHKRRYFKQCR